MKEEGCVFCSIAAGRLPSHKVYEDGEHVAFLDIYPVARGQTLVVPKKHTGSKFYETDDKELTGLVIAAKKVANMLVKKLPAKHVSMVFEGLDVNHLHAKLYPDRGIMHLGERASDSELAEIAKRISE
ncbi:MAG: HIT domain-containing protein [Candidatus Micrarchaeota archaeon]|nr:HIT domain-containing protein [Candidatus Micrarchaeota archaeon]